MRAEECRRKAQHYLICARQMKSPSTRAAMIDRATIWMRMAQRAESDQRALQLMEDARAADKE
jgi:hypothetical protein